MIMVEMFLMPKAVADMLPAGEGRDDPNSVPLHPTNWPLLSRSVSDSPA
jgi:hypothetical protein